MLNGDQRKECLWFGCDKLRWKHEMVKVKYQVTLWTDTWWSRKWVCKKHIESAPGGKDTLL